MKKLIPLGIVAAVLAAKLYAGNLTISFSNQNASTQDCKIVYTTNLAIPTNQWPALAVISNCPPNSTNSFIWSNVPPADYFFSAAWTNSFWKVQSFFSGAVTTPPLATNQVNLLQLINQ